MKTIIMIDDDVDILDVFKLVFERAGYAITIFNKSEPLFNNEFKEPDIFIIDKQLRGVDGLELCRFLKKRALKYDTPVIVFSANPHMEKQAREAGADDFIEKPFKINSLLQMIEKHLN